jgi:LacI family transcriptional regulator
MVDVAKAAGVSVTTVSHVVNETRHVMPGTRRRVLAAIRELGFYKTAHARNLATGSSDFLGLIVSDICNPFFPELIKSFETAALKKGFQLLLCNTDYEPTRTKAAVRKMIENKARGVAVMTSELPKALGEELAAHRVAVVFLDVGPVGKYMANIRVDYSRGIHQAVDHLHSLGHHNFAFVSGPLTLRSAVIRREAFIDGLHQWGAPSDRIAEGNHKVDGGVRAMKLLLARPPLPTAILCSNDLTAIGVLKALAKEGIRVPQDVSVVGFDNIEFSALAHPPLTTVNLSRQHLGKLAFDALDNILKSKRLQGAEYLIGTELIIRRSTSEARSGTLDLSGHVPISIAV